MKRASSGWPEVCLGEVCEFKYGKGLPEASRTGGNVPVFGSNGAVGQHDTALTVGPTIVIGRKGSFGEVNYSPTPCWPIDTTYYVDSTATKADIRWLLYRLSALGLNKLNRAAAVPGLNREDAYRKRLLLPPLPEQRRVAEILDKADALRAKRRAALAQLDTLIQSIFLDMFGDPATNPKGWPKVELGEVAKVVGGYAFKSKDFAADGNPVVRISNLTGDGIDFADIARIHKEKLGKGIGFKIQPGDILIAMSGATTGKLGIVPLKLSENLYQNQRVGNYRISDTTRIQLDYLLGFLRSTFYQRFLWQLAAGVAQPNVSGWQLESAVVPLPLIELQHEFARRVSAVDKLKAAHRASVADLDTLFAALQHRAFRGEL